MRESRLIAINEGERNSTAADVFGVYQIIRGQTEHSALDRMLAHAKVELEVSKLLKQKLFPSLLRSQQIPS